MGSHGLDTAKLRFSIPEQLACVAYPRSWQVHRICLFSLFRLLPSYPLRYDTIKSQNTCKIYNNYPNGQRKWFLKKNICLSHEAWMELYVEPLRNDKDCF